METIRVIIQPTEAVINETDTHKHQIIKAFENLNIKALEQLMSEHDNFEKKDKWNFLSKYKNVFQHFKNKGFERLTSGAFSCNTCYKGTEVASFGDETGNILFGMAIKEENGMVVDMFECTSFGEFSKCIFTDEIKHAKHPI